MGEAFRQETKGSQTKIKINTMTKAEIIEVLKTRFVSRAELRRMVGLKTDVATRLWLSEEVKSEYPVISSAKLRGYKIATSDADLTMAKNCSRENHRKAATLHRNTNVLDRWIIRTECDKTMATIPFAEEVRQIVANV